MIAILFFFLRLSISDDGWAWILCDFLDVGKVVIEYEIDEFQIADIDEDIGLYEFEATANYLQSYHELLWEVGEHPMSYLFIAVIPNQQRYGH